jgi:hypothetical protein
MANEIKKGPEVPFNFHIGGEGGITRRSAPRPFGVALIDGNVGFGQIAVNGRRASTAPGEVVRTLPDDPYRSYRVSIRLGKLPTAIVADGIHCPMEAGR